MVDEVGKKNEVDAVAHVTQQGMCIVGTAHFKSDGTDALIKMMLDHQRACRRKGYHDAGRDAAKAFGVNKTKIGLKGPVPFKWCLKMRDLDPAHWPKPIDLPAAVERYLEGANRRDAAAAAGSGDGSWRRGGASSSSAGSGAAGPRRPRPQSAAARAAEPNDKDRPIQLDKDRNPVRTYTPPGHKRRRGRADSEDDDDDGYGDGHGHGGGGIEPTSMADEDDRDSNVQPNKRARKRPAVYDEPPPGYQQFHQHHPNLGFAFGTPCRDLRNEVRGSHGGGGGSGVFGGGGSNRGSPRRVFVGGRLPQNWGGAGNRHGVFVFLCSNFTFQLCRRGKTFAARSWEGGSAGHSQIGPGTPLLLRSTESGGVFGPFVAMAPARQSNAGNARNKPLANAGFLVQVEVCAVGFGEAISAPVGFAGGPEKRRLTSYCDADTVHGLVAWDAVESTAQFWHLTDDRVSGHARRKY